MSGPKGHILAGWLRHGDDLWFFKLTAPDALAAEQKEKFVKFLQSVEF
jgi:hypothetical protein